MKVIVLNNEEQGMVTQWQNLFYEDRYAHTHQKNPDFMKLADAMGVQHLRVIDRDRVEEHNVSTQLYGVSDVGAWKVDVLRQRIFRATGAEAVEKLPAGEAAGEWIGLASPWGIGKISGHRGIHSS